MKIVVVIPARNEGASIEGVIRELKEVGEEHGFGELNILVVDDSTDETGAIAQGMGATVVRGNGTGLGSAMYLGIREAANRGGDIIVSIDADGQFDPRELPIVLEPILQNKADLVLGSRFLRKGLVEYPMPWINKIGNGILNWIVRRVTGKPITDAQTGYRAMRREVAESLAMIGTHTYVQETIIDAVEKNFRVLEVPVKFRKREHGKSKVVSSVRRYAVYTLPVLLLRAGVHMMFFMAFGTLLILSGLAVGLYVLYSESFRIPELFRRLPALLLVSLLVLMGLQMFFFGIIIHILIEVKNKADRIFYRRPPN